jgi:hypothetical protein
MSRVQTIDIVDASTNGLLDSRTVSSFSGGKYLVWNVKGHVKINFTKVAGLNAVISGVFFGGPISSPSPNATPPHTDTDTDTDTDTEHRHLLSLRSLRPIRALQRSSTP